MKSISPRLRPLVRSAAATFGLLAAAGLAPVASALAAAYPLTIKAANGTVTLAQRPTRIVSLSPSATQDLFAVGAGSQVVAVDSYSTYPPQAPHTSLSAYTPNVEAIANYKPDLVIIVEDIDHVAEQLRALHVPVLLEPSVANLDGAYAEIEQIALATGHPAGGARVVAGMRAQVAAIVRTVAHPARPLTVYDELDQQYYTAASGTFIGQMLKLLGLVNIADKAAKSTEYPQLSAEYVVASDPDVIVLADTVCCKQSPATVRGRAGWSTIAAVRSGAIVPVADSIASQWGPRVVVFLRTVAKAVRKLEGKA